jgi:hypothetical protein
VFWQSVTRAAIYWVSPNKCAWRSPVLTEECMFHVYSFCWKLLVSAVNMSEIFTVVSLHLLHHLNQIWTGNYIKRVQDKSETSHWSRGTVGCRGWAAANPTLLSHLRAKLFAAEFSVWRHDFNVHFPEQMYTYIEKYSWSKWFINRLSNLRIILY